MELLGRVKIFLVILNYQKRKNESAKHKKAEEYILQQYKMNCEEKSDGDSIK